MKDLSLPSMKWVQTYVNGFYTGLYLKSNLPWDKSKKNGRATPRQNLIFINQEGLIYYDTKLRPLSDFLFDYLAEGNHLKLPEPTDKEVFLHQLKNDPVVTGVLNEERKFKFVPFFLDLSTLGLLGQNVNNIYRDTRYKKEMAQFFRVVEPPHLLSAEKLSEYELMLSQMITSSNQVKNDQTKLNRNNSYSVRKWEGLK